MALTPALAVAPPAISTYGDLVSWLAAVGTPDVSEDFDGFDPGTCLDASPGFDCARVDGVLFSSPNYDQDFYDEIRTTTSIGIPTPFLVGGRVPGSPTLDQVIVLDFDAFADAMSFTLEAQDPTASPARVEIYFVNEAIGTLFIGDSDGDETTPEFLGFVTPVPFTRVVITSGDEATGGFEEYGIDNLAFRFAEEPPPICERELTGQTLTSLDGRATDARPGDSGIDSVQLKPGAQNLTLNVDEFDPGDSTATFTVSLIDPSLEGSGLVFATDGSGNTCTLRAEFRPVPAGPLTDELLCTDAGIVFQVSNDDPTSAGTSACSSTDISPQEPDLPAGYEPSPPEDPWPCKVLTLDSTVVGDTEMVYKKDGTFDPRLRILYSRSDDGGLTFPAFLDVTSTVTEIATVIPDPTRLGSTKVRWSPVKVTCAIQAEICNGLDDDGDGEIDEDLPVGDPSIDVDGDGFSLCPAPGGLADCNDQIPAINPAATEVCNGLDDDCAGGIDDGNPGGGLECEVEDQLGACAVGTTRCENSYIVCDQTVFPEAEICDGVDNDCDGETDENFVFGGYQPPVRADGSGIYKRGRTIPFKFPLYDCDGMVVADATPTISLFFYASGIVGTAVEDVESPGAANDGNLYRYDPDAEQYIFNLSTKSLSRGNSYLVRTTLDDGTTHDVVISIR